jgi:hypothetical protein
MSVAINKYWMKQMAQAPELATVAISILNVNIAPFNILLSQRND